ncbi:MAG: SPOR domain-containing protein [Rubrivivax sp.]|jgi:DedD protein
MPLPKLLRRQAPPPAEPDPVWAGEPGAVQKARIQARRRLLGAVVLLGVGVVLFPLLFETEPRPLSTDVPIQVARRDAGPVLTVPAMPPAAPPAASEPAPNLRDAPPAGAIAVTNPGSAPASAPLPAATRSAPASSAPTLVRAAAASAPVPAPATATATAPTPSTVARAPATASSAAPAPARAPAPVAAAASRPARATAGASPAPGPAERTTAAPGTATAPASPSTPAPTASAPAGRFVIQVGAFSDPVALRDARARVEKLGLRTFTQDVETSAGRRTRVRVGPFATREQADAAAVRLKAAGLPAYILAP